MGCELVTDLTWKFCNMDLKGGAVPDEWRSAAVVSSYSGKWEIIFCKSYICIILLSVVEKIILGTLVDRVVRVTKNLIEDEQRF